MCSSVHFYMLLQLGEEGAEVIEKCGFVFFEDWSRVGQVEGAAEAAADAAQNVPHAGQGMIGAEPVFFAHAKERKRCLWGNFREARFDVPVNLADELRQGYIGIRWPITGQKMVEGDVGEDASVAAVGRRKAPDA